MKRWTTIGMLLAAGLLVNGNAWAGAASTTPVDVWTYRGDKVAYGNMRSTRLGSGSSQYLYCGVSGYDDQNPRISCGARDAAGEYAFCSSTNYRFRYMVDAMSDNSLIHFIADSSGECTYLHVRNDSQYRGWD